MADKVATKNKTPRPHPRGNVTPQAEIIRRVDIVEQLIGQGLTTREIINDCTQRFGVCSATVDRYIARVRERWIAEREVERATDVEVTIARVSRMARKLEAKRAWAPWMQAEKLLADIKGVLAPQRHEHKVAAVVAQVGPQAEVPDDFFTEASDDFLDELERKAERMKIEIAAPAPPAPPALPALPSLPMGRSPNDVIDVDDEDA